MNINNLVFFDKIGESYNFSQNAETSAWEGSDYFLPISTALYDVSNLFILEKVGDNYRFPVLEPGSKLTVTWQTAESAPLGSRATSGPEPAVERRSQTWSSNQPDPCLVGLASWAACQIFPPFVPLFVVGLVDRHP